jgi:hypothetical protein
VGIADLGLRIADWLGSIRNPKSETEILGTPTLPLHVHVIRLRGPWQVEPLERYVPCGGRRYKRSIEGLPLSARMTMPADWSGICGNEFLGRVRYHRVFQTPTGLESGERVWLVIEPPRSRGVVTLNRKRLGEVVWGAQPGRYHITDLLEDHNRLEIVVEHPLLDETLQCGDDDRTLLPGGLVGEVRLEIEE